MMDIPTELIKQLARGNGVLFVGAGLSIGAGLPGWSELLKPLAESIGVPANTDLLKIAQYYKVRRGRQALVGHIIEQTDTTGKKPTDNHRRLGRLGVRTWVTTNYDDLLEQTLREAGERFTKVVRDQNLPYISADAVTLVKMHGDREQPDTIVITQQDYYTYFRRFPRVKGKLTGLLLEKTFLFVGYSISDPDFNQIQAEIAFDLQQHQRMAYAALFDADDFTVSDLCSRNVHVLNIPMNGQTNYSERLGELLDDLIRQVDQARQRKAQEVRLSEDDSQLRNYLQAQVDLYDEREWTKRAIALEVHFKGRTRDAREALLNWALRGDSRVTFLSGDFGSGKTWLVRWLACELANRRLKGDSSAAVPIVIPLRMIRNRPISAFSDLVALASPRPLTEEWLHQVQVPVLLLFDGLDELVTSTDIASNDVRRLFSNVASLAPHQSRILVTCRRQVLEPIQGWVSLLLEDLGNLDLQDRTSLAIDLALGKARGTSQVLTICDVDLQQANSYLSQSKAAGIWKQFGTQSAYQQLARLPFTIFLLEEALPILTQQSGLPLLPDLYEAAVDAWLARDCDCSLVDRDILYKRLEDVAESTFTGIDLGSKQYDQLLIRSGILQDLNEDHYEFYHFSVFEYFIARVLARQICEYAAYLLARLNLVYMYNVNRFLIPLLTRDMNSLCQARPIKTAARRLIESCPKIKLADGVSILLDAVTADQFKIFLMHSHWREQEGYGVWTAKSAPDGTQPFQGEDRALEDSLELHSMSWTTVPSFDIPEHPVTAVSWYDAFQFCRWVGGRLPSSDELTFLQDEKQQSSNYEWSSTWFKESQSLVTVVEMSHLSEPSKRLRGLNPDMRSELVGFRVAWPE